MTDRELLELAAKAAGYEFEFNHAARVLANGKLWNPLANDGDAFKLAAKMRMLVDFEDRSVNGMYFEAGDDRTAATRRAIVRAAAEDWR